MSLGSFSEDFYPFVWDFTFSPLRQEVYHYQIPPAAQLFY